MSKWIKKRRKKSTNFCKGRLRVVFQNICRDPQNLNNDFRNNVGNLILSLALGKILSRFDVGLGFMPRTVNEAWKLVAENFLRKIAPFLVMGICWPLRTKTLAHEMRSGDARPRLADAIARVISESRVVEGFEASLAGSIMAQINGLVVRWGSIRWGGDRKSVQIERIVHWINPKEQNLPAHRINSDE